METVSRVEKRQAQALAIFETVDQLDKNKLAEKLGVSPVTAARILKTLANLGYLREIQTTKPYLYEFVQDKPKQLVLSKNISEYKAFYEKELEKFLNSTLSPYHRLVLGGGSTKIFFNRGV